METDKSLEAHLQHLEERLLQPPVRKSAAQIADLLAEDFIEFGASGRIYNRQQIIESLQQEPLVHRSLTHFKTSVLAPDVVLVTYVATRHSSAHLPSASSLRSSIWKWIDDRWQLIFHQGTPAGEP